MPIEASDTTHAAALHDDPAVGRAIEAMLHALREAQTRIDGVRPPRPGCAEAAAATLEQAARLRGRPAFYPYLGSGLGRGPLVELTDGSVKWDMICGIGVHVFGHGDLDLVETALRAALGDTVMQGNLQFNPESVAFAELLVSEASRTSGVRHCFLTSSGAMANESALKICMQKTGGSRVIAFDDCFAGRSLTMAQIGDNPGGRVGLPFTVPVDYVPFFDPREPARSTDEAVRRLRRHLSRYPEAHACFEMELVQGEGGFNVAPREFLEPLMTICREQGVPVWADEVQTFGRTEAMFHFEQLGLGELIDVVSIGKLSQVCGCLYTEALNPKPGLLSGTFVGSTLGLSVGRRMLQRLRDDGYYGPDGRIAALHRVFREQAGRLVERHPEWFPPVEDPDGLAGGEVAGGVGGMMRLTPFGGRKQAISDALHAMFDLGVIAFYCGHGPYHIRLLAPVGVMEPPQMAEVFEIVEEALARTAGNT